jgi:hypothetical protein
VGRKVDALRRKQLDCYVQHLGICDATSLSSRRLATLCSNLSTPRWHPRHLSNRHHHDRSNLRDFRRSTAHRHSPGQAGSPGNPMEQPRALSKSSRSRQSSRCTAARRAAFLADGNRHRDTRRGAERGVWMASAGWRRTREISATDIQCDKRE